MNKVMTSIVYETYGLSFGGLVPIGELKSESEKENYLIVKNTMSFETWLISAYR